MFDNNIQYHLNPLEETASQKRLYKNGEWSSDENGFQLSSLESCSCFPVFVCVMQALKKVQRPFRFTIA